MDLLCYLTKRVQYVELMGPLRHSLKNVGRTGILATNCSAHWTYWYSFVRNCSECWTCWDRCNRRTFLNSGPTGTLLRQTINIFGLPQQLPQQVEHGPSCPKKNWPVEVLPHLDGIGISIPVSRCSLQGTRHTTWKYAVNLLEAWFCICRLASLYPLN